MSQPVTHTLSRSLRLPGPIDVIDRALFLARGLSLRLLSRAWLAAALPALSLLSVYVLERVEGVRSLRPVLAALLVASWIGRALLLSDVSHACGRALGLRSDARASRQDVLRSATLSGFFALLWALPFSGLAKLSPFAVVLALPLLSLRGLLAPSWLARSGNAVGGGVRAWWSALSDVEGARATFFFVEVLSLAGALALLMNVFALLSTALLLGHAFLGLDVAFTSAFVTPDNPFVLLLVGAVTFVLLEPFRVACSSVAYASAITRRDGGDLRAAIEDVIERHQARTAGDHRPGQRTREQIGRTLSIALTFVTASVSTQVSAQENPRDEQVRAQVDQILQRREFVQLADTDHNSFDKMIAAWWADLTEWLRKLLDSDQVDDTPSPFELPSPDPWVVLAVGVTALLLIAAYVYFKRDRGDDDARDEERDDTTIDPTTPPTQWLDDAQRLASSGDFHAALRALYVATIVSLDRRGLIVFEPATTNWQYQRQLPRGELRAAFSQLTRVFDLKHYGKQHTSADDYSACRSLAEQLCREPQA